MLIRFLYTSDLYVDRDHLSRVVKVARAVQPDLVVMGGSVLPEDSALTPDKMGFEQPTFVRDQFKVFAQRIRQLPGSPQVFVLHGNRDWGSSVTAMQELVALKEVSVLTLAAPLKEKGVSFVGYPFTPPTDGFVKDHERLDRKGDKPPFLGGGRWDPRFSRVATHGAPVIFSKHPSMEEDLAKFAAPAGPWIFVTHAPPFGTALDLRHTGQHGGSHAVRATIERTQPLLSLHGHIIESPKAGGDIHDRIGKTTCVNFGQTVGVLQYGIIEVDTGAGSIKSITPGQER